MKKRKFVIMKSEKIFSFLSLILLTFLLSLSVASAAINETEEEKIVGKSIVWLDSQVKEKLDVLSVEELSLSILALSADDIISLGGKTALSEKGKNDECWPSPTCNIKSTAMAMLALNKLGESTDQAAEWLLEQQTAYTATGVTWLLQIDAEQANCTIEYEEKTGTKSYELAVNKDKTYSWIGPSASCLEITNGNYWIGIAKNCLDKAFYVTCDKTAILSLPYKSGTTLYVPSESFSTPASASIMTRCLKKGTSCDYDSTLWAAYALSETGKDYAILIPYLLDQKDANKKYMPDSFLFLLTARTEHAEELLKEQSREGFWSDIGGFGRYYDTAIAYLAMESYAPDNATKAKEWLLKENDEGAWGTTETIRDTALVLAFVWPSAEAVLPSNECQDTYSYSCRTVCEEGEEEFDADCLSGVCCKPSGVPVGCEYASDCADRLCRGEYLKDEITGIRGRCEYPSELTCDDRFDNDGDGRIDEEDSDCKETCSDKLGEICKRGEECDGTVVRTVDTDYCCLGDCILTEEKTCSEQDGIECGENQNCEGDAWISAKDTYFCCTTECKSKFNIIPFIIIALILAIGAAAFFLYKKGFFRKKIVPKKPAYPYYTPPVRPLAQPAPAQPVQPQQPLALHMKFFPKQMPSQEKRVAVKREMKTDLDETMKKLKKLAEKEEK